MCESFTYCFKTIMSSCCKIVTFEGSRRRSSCHRDQGHCSALIIMYQCLTLLLLNFKIDLLTKCLLRSVIEVVIFIFENLFYLDVFEIKIVFKD